MIECCKSTCTHTVIQACVNMSSYKPVNYTNKSISIIDSPNTHPAPKARWRWARERDGLPAPIPRVVHTSKRMGEYFQSPIRRVCYLARCNLIIRSLPCYLTHHHHLLQPHYPRVVSLF